MRIALSIAGSDSGGGAGIQADLKSFQRFGVFGTSVITAITAQNTRGVDKWDAVSVDLVRAQIESVVVDMPPSAFKTGMLATAAIASLVATAIDEHSLTNYVLDPVMVASSGDVLFEKDTIDVIRRDLISRAFLVTPNIHEAEILIGEKIEDEDGMARAAEMIVTELGAQAALVKGGHLESGERVLDVLYDGDIRTFPVGGSRRPAHTGPGARCRRLLLLNWRMVNPCTQPSGDRSTTCTTQSLPRRDSGQATDP
ncbi:MAG TPA: bifunctional hydroxymethylpyrimidine kinase/phosphomethylpyrimidine kinase [Gemmatimonadaceae bacterium]|jgi:hydroxymethylpyrimidine/phosphomethylpyrimidine kinase